jgi:D-apionolactonase
MSSLNQIYHGKSTGPDIFFKLQAGRVRLYFCNGAVRTVMVDDSEIVRRIYVAVRDDIWNTTGYSLSNLAINSTGSSFQIEFDCRHKKGSIDFIWHGSISGTTDSTIRFSMQGQALSSFQSNRIGFCVLHPLSGCLGKPCTIITTRGEKIKSRFPTFISPHQPFKNIRTIIQKINGIELCSTFKGNTFEMEDQRNWTDASFKTYCPPLSQPRPFLVKKGTRFSQSIEISVAGKIQPSQRTRETAAMDVHVDTCFRPEKIPDIGCIFRLHQAPAGLRLARLLRLSHMRIDVTVSQSGIASALNRVKGISTGLDVPLEIALYFSQAPLKKQIPLVLDMIAALQLPVKRFLVFRREETVTSAKTVQTVLPALRAIAPGARIVAGTDAFFVEINRKHPSRRGIDGICYSVNPQVHTFDDQSILENLEGQVYTVQTARRLGRDAPVYATPITLRPRLNPDQPEKFHGPDVRQKSLLGAVWTLGSIIRLAEAGAAGATYFELSGPGGVMEHGGRRVFPLFHVIADVNEFSGGTMRLLAGEKSSGILGCMVEKAGRKRVFVANLSLQEKTVIISGLPKNMIEKHLDETTFSEACILPETFRNKKGKAVRISSGSLRIELRPYGIARLEQ